MSKNIIANRTKNKKQNKKKILILALSVLAILVLTFVFLLKKDKIIIAMKVNTNDVFGVIDGNVNPDIDGGIGFAIKTSEGSQTKNILNVITKDKSLKEIYQTNNNIDDIYYYEDFVILREPKREQYATVTTYKKINLKDYSSEKLYEDENPSFVMYINDDYMFLQYRDTIKAIPFAEDKDSVTLNYNDIVSDIAKQKNIYCSYDREWGAVRIDDDENAYFRTESILRLCSADEFVIKLNLKTFNYEGVSKMPDNEKSVVRSCIKEDRVDSIEEMSTITGYNDGKNKASIKNNQHGQEYIIDEKHSYTKASFLPDNYIELIYLSGYSFNTTYYNIKKMRMEPSYYNFDKGKPLAENYEICFISN